MATTPDHHLLESDPALEHELRQVVDAAAIRIAAKPGLPPRRRAVWVEEQPAGGQPAAARVAPQGPIEYRHIWGPFFSRSR